MKLNEPHPYSVQLLTVEGPRSREEELEATLAELRAALQTWGLDEKAVLKYHADNKHRETGHEVQ